ncbi:flagellar hook capping FlgD N-terminal domain-containing protein [Actomonas aquatica]|uniref:Basal-body rod modification protein FlgD n=1 Tax=Actomonas aquatica TaxID=2866162 RepID=A0ABZ1CC79_9BACT|nr:flagellar hook capping FlgD N-terminal domain-containing protein [Opitutus sp. WL0086]WRQ89276.1 flagellar hook capping FlgD N-terminal domain-containing protein [Opitutus sp. WL0086]
MPSVNSTTYMPAASMGPADNAATTRVPKQALGQEDFLKLLTVQMTKQDPMKPMEDTAFIAQMAQFSSLEQMNSLTNDFARLRLDQQMTTASNLIGREVTVDDGEAFTTGIVEAVDNSSVDGVTVVINGQSYDLSTVTRIAPPSVTDPDTF